MWFIHAIDKHNFILDTLWFDTEEEAVEEHDKLLAYVGIKGVVVALKDKWHVCTVRSNQIARLVYANQREIMVRNYKVDKHIKAIGEELDQVKTGFEAPQRTVQ